KESDRIAAMERELTRLGVRAKGLPDGLEITGPASFQAGDFVSGGDHRIAMSMAIAATQAKAASQVCDVDCVQTSYPDFFRHLAELSGVENFFSTFHAII
ncbi:MAG TPA: 3-phosphoshikimate 1-carboxyvinyltransferase, partial [Deltaproteobacteria bacterium]|nr:3-phosphoshikimate 1-carboxyvinyltransferase [Deltaproteobacteria bacterium]